jgi:TRAP-type uncharacterized transport system fused permease subunit
MFYFSPTLLLQGSIQYILLNSITAIIGVSVLSAGVMGFFKTPLSMSERVIMMACGFLLIHPTIYTDVIAFVFVGYIYLRTYLRIKREQYNTSQD